MDDDINWNAQGLQNGKRSHSRHRSSDNLDQEEQSYNVKGHLHGVPGQKEEFNEIFRQKSRKLKRVVIQN